MSEEGKFIVIEGPDGSGTTTQTSALARKLSEKGYPSVSTFEPTDSGIGGLIRKKLSDGELFDWKTMTCLFYADRFEHVKWIREQLNKGLNVVCDRYDLSTFFYQSVHDQLDAQSIITQIQSAFDELDYLEQDIVQPDLTFILSCSVDDLIQRIKERKKTDVYESEDFLKKVCKSYLGWRGKFVVHINGMLSIKTITDVMFDKLRKKGIL